MNGNDLLQKGQDWAAWFAIPYVKKPNSDPEFRIYFSKEWYEALHLSALLEEKDGQLWQLRSNASSLVDASTEETKS
ncbi:WD repeat-containing protein 91 homolog [Prunus yedoensis var. nudiflora]|uniref:WD repeat-containing protein 91 homolog n=1 Tax=Prunus yedoensis var. nudiflora TaxID=2094558 RepID=A0A314XJF7_PRUYE|nr:WD repeat-containing protein 91 homolog [Prunus yedoensis var. nudiflora]